MSDEQKINSNTTPINQGPISGPYTDNTNAKALKALLYELEQLLSACTEAATSDTTPSSRQGKLVLLLQNDPAKFAELLKKIGKGSVESPEFHEVLQAISAFVASTKGYDNSKVAKVLAEYFKGTAEAKESDEFVTTGLEMFDTFTNAVNSGETSLDEGFRSPPMKAFIGELMNEGHKATSTAVRASLVALFEGKKGDDKFIEKVIDISVNASVNKTSDGKEVLNILTSPEKLADIYNSANRQEAINNLGQKALPTNNDQSYVVAMMKMAVSLAGLLGNVMEAQTITSDMGTKIIQKQGENAKTLATTHINSIQVELAAEADAAQKPWYMTLIAVVLAIAGAVLTFFTAGAAAPAIVALVIGLVMASPAGDAITGGLSKAIGGDKEGPGSQAAAGAIVAVFTTILSCGSAGFTSAVEVTADIGVEEIGNNVGEAAGTAAGAAGGAAVDNGAAIATDEAIEEAVDETADQAATQNIGNNTRNATTGMSKFVQKIKDGFNQKWNPQALLAGLTRRAIGTYIQQFLGTGGLTNSAEAIALAVNPKIMDSLAAQLSFAIGGAILSIAGSLGVAKGVTNVGDGERAVFMAKNSLQDGIVTLSKPIEYGARGLQFLGTVAQGAVSINQSQQEINIASLQEQTTTSDAKQTAQKYSSERASELAADTGKAYSDMVESLNDTLNQALQSIGGEEQNNKRSASK